MTLSNRTWIDFVRKAGNQKKWQFQEFLGQFPSISPTKWFDHRRAHFISKISGRQVSLVEISFRNQNKHPENLWYTPENKHDNGKKAINWRYISYETHKKNEVNLWLPCWFTGRYSFSSPKAWSRSFQIWCWSNCRCIAWRIVITSDRLGETKLADVGVAKRWFSNIQLEFWAQNAGR